MRQVFNEALVFQILTQLRSNVSLNSLEIIKLLFAQGVNQCKFCFEIEMVWQLLF